MKRKIGLLCADSIRPELVEKHGEYFDMFCELLYPIDANLRLVNYHVHLGEFPEKVDEVDAYLISGSSASVYEDRPWIHQLGEFVSMLHAQKKPTIGICFGHQLIAQVLGGKTEKARVGWQIGNHAHRLTEAGKRILPAGENFELIFSNQDQVVIPPEDSLILASTASCPIAVCRIGTHMLTIQGHPEMQADYARDLLNLRKDLFEESLYNTARESLRRSNDRRLAGKWMADFVQRRNGMNL